MPFAFLLSERERDRFTTYKTPKANSSVSANLLWGPLFSRLAKLVPQDIAPNILSLASALVLVQGWYITETHSARFPIFSSVFVAISLLVWFALDQIDEFHAANIGNDYSFVELFDHVCSSIASIFLGLTLSRIFLGPNADRHAVWYVIQIGQLVLLNKHVQALRQGKLTFSRTRGPGEGVAFVLTILLVRTVLVGPVLFDGTAVKVLNALTPSIIATHPHAPPYFALLAVIHFLEHVYFLIQTFFMREAELRPTRNLLQLSVLILYIPSVIDAVSRYFFGLPDLDLFSEATIISDALILSVLTCDVVVCRMASRHLHPIIPVLCMVAVSSVPLTIALSAVYFLTLFFELSFHQRLPILGVIRNVYVDGIFDMVHIGHVKHFGRAAQLGTRLLVGVVNDEDATPYKRKPIMTHDERCEMVAACKFVYKVIPNAPCVKGGLNEEFLKKHNIHIVGCGEEYEKPDDEWYGIPRRLGMTRVLPRTQGMSTSDLIARIKQRSEKEGKEIMSHETRRSDLDEYGRLVVGLDVNNNQEDTHTLLQDDPR